LITVLRIGHRPARDKRITTHVALTARAFGASAIIIDLHDSELESNIRSVVDRFGGDFQISSGVNWRRYLEESGAVKVHLTMYGIPVQDCIDNIREDVSRKGNLIITVGAEKVPGDLYGVADYNVSVTNQPHSEVAALALFLDRYNHGDELSARFEGRMEVIPKARGKEIRNRVGNSITSTKPKRKD
jgi:tRNA (cytidine56-2'-O)-methyltransferase